MEAAVTSDTLIVWASHYAFYYPLTMAWLWIVGALYFRRRWEGSHQQARDQQGDDEDLREHERTQPLREYPFVSLMVPCHNEGPNVEETVLSLLRQNWPDFEVIAINDCSTDDTGAALDRLAAQHPRLRVVHLKQNHGKAMALRMGALVARSEFLVCIDGDALLDPHATHWIMWHFLNSPRVGAVTGNPRVRNRTSVLGRIQVGEFGSLIGLIKRSQRVYGAIFSVSGVIAAFRRAALQEIGYWNTDMITEDVDITWRLQLAGWDIRFEARALCWILVPESIRGLWRQRLRWAQGGAEVIFRHLGEIVQWRSRAMWPVFLEYLCSILWVWIIFAALLVTLLGKLLPYEFGMTIVLPQWHGIVLGATCLTQFLVGLLIDSHFEPKMKRKFFWLIWYPLFYWLINLFTVVVGLPKALMRRKGQPAVWTSPDRGVHQAADRSAA